MAIERIIDYDGTFFRGMSSNGDPGQLPLGYYWNSMNTINTGGVVSCRPGYRCLVKLPKGNLQGCTIFRPKIGLEQMVVVIDGAVYVAPFPFLDFTILTNVQMLPYAKQVFFMQAVQSANRINDDFSSPIEVINPRNVLFIQDGGNTAPAWYDGSNSGHIRDKAFETPIGGPMMWVGDRLWVANLNRVYASDISNPFSFREQVYLGAVQGFEFDGEVTALAKTPSLESPQLIAFTEANASILQANIRERASWPNTNGFQTEILQTGCVSARSVVNHFGKLAWFSPGGTVVFDFATGGKISMRLPIRDNEMAFSKNRISDNLDLIAGASFGQYLLMSVPANDYFNKDTWCLNDCSFETLADESGPSWNSYWRGTRPVQWVSGVISGVERIYHVSLDEDGENRLWEAFTPDRLDNGCPITWFVETRGYFGATSGVKKIPGSDCRFQWADIGLSGVEEDLNLGVFFSGSLRGGYKPVLAKKLSVERGSLSYQRDILATTSLFAFKPEERVLRTQDANQQPISSETGTCSVESDKLEEIDSSFQLLIIGQGPATIRWIRSWALSTPEDLSGSAIACEDEAPYNTVRFDGAGQSGSDLPLVVEELAMRELFYFTSVQTAVVAQDGFSAVGLGISESIISQAAADRVAKVVATKQAEAELRSVLPPVLSIGEGFDE